MESPWPTELGLEAPDFQNLNYAITLVNTNVKSGLFV
jgi:hypothetical protein